MIRKNITLMKYVDALLTSLEKVEVANLDVKDDERNHLLKVQAEVFLETFGREVSEKMIRAFDMELEQKRKEEYYKIMVMFFKRIGAKNTGTFFGYLSISIREKENEG